MASTLGSVCDGRASMRMVRDRAGGSRSCRASLGSTDDLLFLYESVVKLLVMRVVSFSLRFFFFFPLCV